MYATTERGEQIKKDSYVLCESLANYLKETTTTTRRTEKISTDGRAAAAAVESRRARDETRAINKR